MHTRFFYTEEKTIVKTVYLCSVVYKGLITQCKHIPFKNVHNGDALSPITSTLSNN